jgi:hypothetical protein
MDKYRFINKKICSHYKKNKKENYQIKNARDLFIPGCVTVKAERKLVNRIGEI